MFIWNFVSCLLSQGHILQGQRGWRKWLPWFILIVLCHGESLSIGYFKWLSRPYASDFLAFLGQVPHQISRLSVHNLHTSFPHQTLTRELVMHFALAWFKVFNASSSMGFFLGVLSVLPMVAPWPDDAVTVQVFDVKYVDVVCGDIWTRLEEYYAIVLSCSRNCSSLSYT